MKWNKYSIQTTTEAVDFISSMLGELGIEGIEIEDNVQLTQEEAKTMFVDFIPDLPPDDGSAKVNFYIDSDEDDNTIMDKVKDGLEELRKGSKAAGVRIGLCVLLIVGKGISVAPYADKRLGHTASMAPPLPYAASLIKNRLGRLG